MSGKKNTDMLNVPMGMHTYEHPESCFEIEMAAIVDTLTNNTHSPYFAKDGLDARNQGIHVDLSNLQAVAKIQKAYDILGKSDFNAHMRTKVAFHRILCAITGTIPGDDYDEAQDGDCCINGVPEKDDQADENVVRFYIRNGLLDEACWALDEDDIPYDIDSSDRIMIDQSYLDDARNALYMAGIEHDEI